MSLKDTSKIVLPKEFTDLTLPYNFPVHIKDIIESSGMDSIAIYKWSNDSGTFVTRGHYIPGKANRQNINDSLDWKYHNAYYSIYNMYSKDTTLKFLRFLFPCHRSYLLKGGSEKHMGYHCKLQNRFFPNIRSLLWLC